MHAGRTVPTCQGSSPAHRRFEPFICTDEGKYPCISKMQDMALHTSSVWYTLVNCSIPRFRFNVEQLASIYHHSERGEKVPAEYVRTSQNMDVKSLTKLHSYAMTSVSIN